MSTAKGDSEEVAVARMRSLAALVARLVAASADAVAKKEALAASGKVSKGAVFRAGVEAQNVAVRLRDLREEFDKLAVDFAQARGMTIDKVAIERMLAELAAPWQPPPSTGPSNIGRPYSGGLPTLGKRR